MSNNMEIVVAKTDLQALYKTTSNVLKNYNSGDEVPEKIKGQSVLSVMKKLFDNNHFSICAVNDLQEMHKVEISSEHYKWMHTLHCVKFTDMHPDTREYLFALCIEYFKPIISMSYAE